MPYSSAAERRPQLLNLWSLGVVAFLCLLILVLVFPQQSVFKLGENDQADAVSIAYAELLLRSNPGDDGLRLQLVDQLIRVGNLDRAQALLVAPVADRFAADAAMFSLEIAVQRAFARPEGIAAQGLGFYQGELTRLLAMDLKPERLQRLAELALAFSAPKLAAQAYTQLAAVDAENAPYWLEQGARWFTAAGLPVEAAALYQRLEALAQSPTERERFQLQVFNSLVAGGESARALRWLDKQLAQLSHSSWSIDLLQAGIREARGHSDSARALAYLQRWHELQPDDLDWLQQAFVVTLSTGELEQAWTLGQQLYQQQPSEALLRQLAQLGEWAGHPAQALPLWIELARQTGAAEDYVYAWRLSGQLFDFPQMSRLLTELSEIRALDLEELQALVYALESQALPEQARDWLTLYVLRRPAARDAWRMLAQINRNMLHLHDETLVWADMARRHALTEAERIVWAQAHWLLFQPQPAWDVLTVLPLDKRRSLEFLALRSELAEALELDSEQIATLEQLLARRQRLTNAQSEQLLQLYLQADPQKALELAVANWRQSQSLNRLVLALQLARQLGQWPLLDSLLQEAQPFAAQLQGEPVYWQVRIASASQRGDTAQLDRLLTQLLAQFPDQSWAIEVYLWSQIDRQQRAGLAARLQEWRPLARQEANLWLPFASAYALLGNVDESLRWFERHVRANPQDQLALAAYADMLEQAGQADSAWRLRRYLLAQWQRNPDGDEALQPERYLAYLRLLSSVAGIQRARLVSQQPLARGLPAAQQQPLLEAWFERWIVQLETSKRTGAIDPWLAWAKERGIRIDRFTQLQSALRAVRQEELQALLDSDSLAPESRAEIWLRLGLDQRAQQESLQALSSERSAAQNRTLRNQAQGVLQRQPRGLQLGWQDRDYGGLRQKGTQLLAANNVGDRYLSMNASDSRYSDSDLLDSGRLGREQTLALSLETPLQDGSWLLEGELAQNDFADRHGLGLARNWRVTDTDSLSLGLDWQRQTDESGLMHALGMRDSLQAAGQHGLSARDQLSWRLARNRYSTFDGDDLGDGWSAALDLSHSLLAHEPQWLVRTGVSWQENNPVGQLPDALLRSNGGVLLDNAVPTDLLTDRFGELYVGSSWQRGVPGALNRAWPQFTWRLDTRAGWQWPEQSFAWAVEAGAGVEVFGDDELALVGGYNSAPVGGDGQAGSIMRLTYSLRFGR